MSLVAAVLRALLSVVGAARCGPMMLAASVSPPSSLGSSPVAVPASPSSPLDVDVDLELDIDADMHSVAPFSLSPAPSTASAASSAGSHPPSPYQLPQRVYPLRVSTSSLNSSPSLSAFSAPTAQNVAAAARHVCAVHHTPVHHHHHHIHYTTPTASTVAAAPFKAAATIGIATSPQFNPPSSPPTSSYMYMQSALPARVPSALLPPVEVYNSGGGSNMSHTTMHSTHTQYTLAHAYGEVGRQSSQPGKTVRLKREEETTEAADERLQHLTAERSDTKRKRAQRGDDDEQHSKPGKQRPKLHVSTSSTSLASSSSESIASPPSSSRSSLSSALVFTCPDCPRRFTRNSNLTRHKRIHSGQRRFTCVECSKGFMEKHHLTAHMRTHTGEKPYKCPQCPRQFTDRSNCSRHIRTHGLSPLGSDSEAEEGEEMAEAERPQKAMGKLEAVRSKTRRHSDSGTTTMKVKVKVEGTASNGAAAHEPAAPTALPGASPSASTEVASVAQKVDEAMDATSCIVHSAAPLLSTPLLQASPAIVPAGSPPSSYVVELRGRKDSLEPFNLSVGTLPSPLLSAAPSSPGRRSSFPFALSPAFPSSSSPALQLLSVSLSPALPPSVLLSGGSRMGLIGEVSPAPRVYSIASTMAAMTSTPSLATSSSPAQSAETAHSSLDVPSSPSGATTVSSMDAVAPSPRTHHAVTSLLSAANDAQTKHNHTQQTNGSSIMTTASSPTSAAETNKGAKTPVSASEHLQALYDKVMAEKHHQADKS